MLDLISRWRTTACFGSTPPVPWCSDHPDSLVRRFRTHGPNGPGVYPQCVPNGGVLPAQAALVAREVWAASLVLVDPGAHASASERANVGVGERRGCGRARVANRFDVGVSAPFAFCSVEPEDRCEGCLAAAWFGEPCAVALEVARVAPYEDEHCSVELGK
jgi:hypothetical protein